MADKKKYRRSNGEGSIFRHSNGRWCGQVSVGFDENGKRIRKSVYGQTRAEVVEKVSQLQGKANACRLKASAKTTLGQFTDSWLRDFKRPSVSARTYEWYLNIQKSIDVSVKERPLMKVSSFEIQNMLSTMKQEGSSVRGIKAAYDLLNQVFKAAVEFEMAPSNPMDKVKIVRNEISRKPKALNASEREAVMKAVEGHIVYRPIIYTMMGMGLRIGEVLALTWADVDFTGNKVSISKAAKITPVVGGSGAVEGHVMAVSGTKTSRSVRTLPMPRFVRDALWEWRKVHMRRFKTSDTKGFVFPNKYGELRSYSGFRRQFERFLKERGIAKVTFHQFRHTFATMMLEQQVNPRVVQEYLGHKDISTTLGIYTGVTSSAMKQAADGVDVAMRGMV